MENTVLWQIAGGGAVAVAIIFGIVKLIEALNKRSTSNANSAAQQQQQTNGCALWSGQIVAIMNRQTELLTRLVEIDAARAAELAALRGVAVSNQQMLSQQARDIGVLVDRSSH